MSKSKLEKLKEAIEGARSFIVGITVGEDLGQYIQVDVDEFNSIVERAESIAIEDGLEPSQYDAALKTLNEGLATLQSKVNKETTEPQIVSKPALKVISLKGTVSQCTGSHTLHYNQTVVTFRDGEAELPEALANELIEAGYAE